MILIEFQTQVVMYPFLFVPYLIRRHQSNNANNVVNRSADSGSDGEDGCVGSHSPPFVEESQLKKENN